jgi:glycine cleavage system H protein
LGEGAPVSQDPREFPADLYYLIEHQVWARLESGGMAQVGITSLGVELAGEIYMCRPKNAGVTVEQGHSIAVVELAKSIVSVKSPVRGVVAAVNPALATMPELVHTDPYGQGWIARVLLSDFEADRPNLVHGPGVLPAMCNHARLHRVD